MPELTTPAPKKKDLRRAASAATTHHKKSKSSISKRQGTISIDNVGHGQTSPPDNPPIEPAAMPVPLQDQREMEEKLVELDHLRTLNIEVDRERSVTQKVQSDVELLRKQLARADQQN